MSSIGDAQGLSDIAPITPSGDFNIKTLTGVTLSWKTKSNRSIFTMENRIPELLQHRCKVCCEKGSCHGRQALIVGKECIMEICFLDEQTWHMTVVRTVARKVVVQEITKEILQRQFLKYKTTRSLDDKLPEDEIQKTGLYANKYGCRSISRYG